MSFKLYSFDSLLIQAAANNKNSDGVLCIDMDELFKELENIRIDIKTLDSEIEYAYWNVEVS